MTRPSLASLVVRRAVRRLGRFHRDRRAQVIPLFFFCGIAFFAGVCMVINTGRDVNLRIESQDAVDAAAVSGANAEARGMNYLASNNISMAKLLASIVILRSFEGAIDASDITLDIWQGVADFLLTCGWVPFVGGALVATGEAINVIIQIERPILDDFLKPATDELKNVWDDNGNGIAWIALRVLSQGVAEVLAWVTPVVAQWTSHETYAANLTASGGDGQAWLLPLYPALPICQGKFGEFFDKTKEYTEEYATPIEDAGWVVLTLSLFPVWYEQNLKIQLKELFTGETGTADSSDPDQKRMKELKEDIDAKSKEIDAAKKERDRIEAQINAVKAGKKGKDLPYDDLPSDLNELQNKWWEQQGKIDTLQDQIEADNDELKKIMNNRKNAGSSGGDLGDLGGSTASDRDYPKPWLVKGDKWPQSFSYMVIGWRNLKPPVAPGAFDRPYDTGIVYAASRLYNPTSADLWTPDWRAKLVRSQVDLLPTNPIGNIPGKCADGDSTESGEGKLDSTGIGSPEGGADGAKGTLQKILDKLSKH